MIGLLAACAIGFVLGVCFVGLVAYFLQRLSLD